jgi:sugar/nucleoside kinase (ribokinase family)
MVDVHVGVAPAGSGSFAHGAIELRPGGSPVTAALTARAAGGAVLVAGRIGDDPAGRMIAAALAEHGVDTRLATDAAAPTGVCVYAGGGVTASRGANARVSPDDLPERITARAVLVSGYLLSQPDSRAAGRAALERSDARWIAVDVAAPTLAGPSLLAEPAVTVVFANAAEARALTGEDDVAAARSLARHFEVVFVKRGAAGAIACSGAGLVRHAEPRVEPEGRPGTGDAFAGAALLELARGGTPEEALRAGCRAGATAAAGAPI